MVRYWASRRPQRSPWCGCAIECGMVRYWVSRRPQQSPWVRMRHGRAAPRLGRPEANGAVVRLRDRGATSCSPVASLGGRQRRAYSPAVERRHGLRATLVRQWGRQRKARSSALGRRHGRRTTVVRQLRAPREAPRSPGARGRHGRAPPWCVGGGRLRSSVVRRRSGGGKVVAPPWCVTGRAPQEPFVRLRSSAGHVVAARLCLSPVPRRCATPAWPMRPRRGPGAHRPSIAHDSTPARMSVRGELPVPAEPAYARFVLSWPRVTRRSPTDTATDNAMTPRLARGAVAWWAARRPRRQTRRRGVDTGRRRASARQRPPESAHLMAGSGMSRTVDGKCLGASAHSSGIHPPTPSAVLTRTLLRSGRSSVASRLKSSGAATTAATSGLSAPDVDD